MDRIGCDIVICPKCGLPMTKAGKTMTTAGKRQRWHCTSEKGCGYVLVENTKNRSIFSFNCVL